MAPKGANLLISGILPQISAHQWPLLKRPMTLRSFPRSARHGWNMSLLWKTIRLARSRLRYYASTTLDSTTSHWFPREKIVNLVMDYCGEKTPSLVTWFDGKYLRESPFAALVRRASRSDPIRSARLSYSIGRNAADRIPVKCLTRLTFYLST